MFNLHKAVSWYYNNKTLELSLKTSFSTTFLSVIQHKAQHMQQHSFHQYISHWVWMTEQYSSNIILASIMTSHRFHYMANSQRENKTYNYYIRTLIRNHKKLYIVFVCELFHWKWSLVAFKIILLNGNLLETIQFNTYDTTIILMNGIYAWAITFIWSVKPMKLLTAISY